MLLLEKSFICMNNFKNFIEKNGGKTSPHFISEIFTYSSASESYSSESFDSNLLGFTVKAIRLSAGLNFKINVSILSPT